MPLECDKYTSFISLYAEFLLTSFGLSFLSDRVCKKCVQREKDKKGFKRVGIIEKFYFFVIEKNYEIYV